MQNDGNLVIYNQQRFYTWLSQTSGHPGSRLIVQDDGDVVINAPDDTRLWATDTSTQDLHPLTDEFRQIREAYEKLPAESAFSLLRLIGERRKSTPGPDDQMFLTATTVRQDFSKATFNGLKNRTLRDVEIAGPLLRWSGSNRILANYYG
jgi:hypothetical protein